MKTLALVVGNNNYSKNAKLENAINDAKAISEIFEKLGYDVIFKEDMSNADCSELLSQFEEKINNYDASIFYFAGHGFQFDAKTRFEIKASRGSIEKGLQILDKLDKEL